MCVFVLTRRGAQVAPAFLKRTVSPPQILVIFLARMSHPEVIIVTAVTGVETCNKSKKLKQSTDDFLREVSSRCIVGFCFYRERGALVLCVTHAYRLSFHSSLAHSFAASYSCISRKASWQVRHAGRAQRRHVISTTSSTRRWVRQLQSKTRIASVTATRHNGQRPPTTRAACCAARML